MAHVWAIADLHLSFGVPNKKMDLFGAQWVSHAEKIRSHWLDAISADDLVLLAGDLSWAMTLDEVAADLQWLAALPGTKVLIKGNHDYWWSSLSKIQKVLPPSCHLIQNSAFQWNEYSIGGTRLWDTSEYQFNALVEFKEPEVVVKNDSQEDERIFQRELNRLEMSLKALHPQAEKRIVMTHYPPISADLKPSRVSELLEKYHVDVCVFGHLHGVKPNTNLFGERNGVQYLLTACDFLDFKPLKLY